MKYIVYTKKLNWLLKILSRLKIIKVINSNEIRKLIYIQKYLEHSNRNITNYKDYINAIF